MQKDYYVCKDLAIVHLVNNEPDINNNTAELYYPLSNTTKTIDLNKIQLTNIFIEKIQFKDDNGRSDDRPIYPNCQSITELFQIILHKNSIVDIKLDKDRILHINNEILVDLDYKKDKFIAEYNNKKLIIIENINRVKIKKLYEKFKNLKKILNY